MSAIFLSDVHLKEPEGVKTKLVLKFLQQKASQFDEIFILGDFFDVWPATTPYLLKKYGAVLQVLSELKNGGSELHYFEGNHDFHLGRYFSDNLGIRVYQNSKVFNWDGRKIFIAHGDLANRKEKGYRMLRMALRTPVTKTALQLAPQRLIDFMGQKSADLSRDYQSRAPRNEEAIRQVYRDSARRLFKKGYDVVLMGHTHLPDDMKENVEGRECRYLNTGDWVQHFSFVEFDGEEFYTRSHPLKRGLSLDDSFDFF